MLKVLVVDDEKMTRDILLNYIPWRELGIGTVEEADDGLSALTLAIHSKPDIILSDVKMPKMNGIEMATQVREVLPDCKFVFLSGYSDKEYLKSAIKLKAVNYVEKPIDLDEIKGVMKNTIAECLEEKKEREENQALAGQKFCLELIDSKVNADSIKEKIELLDLGFTERGKYVSVVIKLNFNYFETIEEQTAYNKTVLNLLDTLFTKAGTKYVLGNKGDDYIIIHVYSSPLKNFEQLQDLLESFISKLRKLCSHEVRLMIGAGQEVTGLVNIFKSYQTAVISIQKQFYTGYNSAVFYIEDYDTPYIFDDSILPLIGEYVKAKKKAETLLLIKRMANDIRNHKNTPPDFVKNVFFKIILVLSRIAEDRNIPFLNGECEFILDSISKAYTLNEIEKSVIELISSIISHMENKVENGDIISKITNYINENFHNENLSINSLAEAFFLTPTYLCIIFKKETGKTINQYITEKRICQAREYLKETGIKLYDIARRVGYSDGKYFTKVFDKAVGMKPKEFREIHCRDKKNI